MITSTIEVRSSQTISQNCRSEDQRPLPSYAQGTLENTWGGYRPHQGYLKVPDALISGSLLTDFKLPASALTVLLTAHKLISLSGQQWISRQDIARYCLLHESVIRRSLQACLTARLATERRRLGRQVEYAFEGLYTYLQRPRQNRHFCQVSSPEKPPKDTDPTRQIEQQILGKSSSKNQPKPLEIISNSDPLQRDTKINNKSIDRFVNKPVDPLSTEPSDDPQPQPEDPTTGSGFYPNPSGSPNALNPLADRTALFRAMLDHPDIQRLLDAIGAVDADRRTLAADAATFGHGLEAILDALQKTAHYRPRNPMGYVRSLLRQKPAAAPSSPATEDRLKRQAEEAERQRLEDAQRCEELKGSQKALEHVLQTEAYAQVRSLAQQQEICLEAVAGCFTSELPEPAVLHGALQTACERSRGDVVMFWNAFLEALESPQAASSAAKMENGAVGEAPDPVSDAGALPLEPPQNEPDEKRPDEGETAAQRAPQLSGSPPASHREAPAVNGSEAPPETGRDGRSLPEPTGRPFADALFARQGRGEANRSPGATRHSKPLERHRLDGVIDHQTDRSPSVFWLCSESRWLPRRSDPKEGRCSFVQRSGGKGAREVQLSAAGQQGNEHPLLGLLGRSPPQGRSQRRGSGEDR